MPSLAFATSFLVPRTIRPSIFGSDHHSLISPTVCSVKGPSKNNRLPNNEKLHPKRPPIQNNPHIKASNEKQNLDDSTITEISQQLSQTLGLSLLFDDMEKIRDFFSSFIKQRGVGVTQDESPSDGNGHQGLGDPQRPGTLPEKEEGAPAGAYLGNRHDPKSRMGRAVATQYVTTRGYLDRKLERVALRTKSIVQLLATATTGAVYSLLSAAEGAFPSLGLSPARQRVKEALSDGWSPLKVFEWQLLPGGDADADRERVLRRRKRLESISQFLRGVKGPLSSIFVSSISTIKAIATSIEAVSPSVFKQSVQNVMATAAFVKTLGTANRALAAELPATPQPELGTRQQPSILDASKKDAVDLSPSASSSNGSERGKGMANWNQIPTMAASPLKSEQIRSGREASFQVPAIASDAPSSSDRVVPTAAIVGSGAALFGAGTIISAVAGFPLSTIVSCSALVITCVTFAGGQARKSNGPIYGRAQQLFRRSESVRKLENFVQNRAFPSDNGYSLPLARHGVHPKSSNPKLREDFVPDSEHEVITVDTSSRTQGSTPAILTVPVIGAILSWLDRFAFHVELTSVTIRRRTGLDIISDSKRNEWKPLRSFSKPFG